MNHKYFRFDSNFLINLWEAVEANPKTKINR